MSKRKVKILKAVTPPGFQTKIVINDSNGKPIVVERMDICKPGDVIELDAELAGRYIAGEIAAPASNIDKVTKTANNGAFEDAASGPEKQNPVPAKADA